MAENNASEPLEGEKSAHSSSLSRHFPSQDTATGLLSRRHFLEEAISEFRKFKRYGHPFTFLVLDLDQFDQFYQADEPEVGNLVLKHLAATLSQMLREHDLIGRLGQEQFGILLLQTGHDSALITAERLRETCSRLTFPGKQVALNLTVSIGMSEVKPQDTSFEEVFLRADSALVIAKENGCNQVSVTV